MNYYFIAIVIGSVLISCTRETSKKMQNYTHDEVRKAVILAVSAKLEEKYHVDKKWHQINTDQNDRDILESDEAKKIDFIKRLKNNQDQKDIL